MTGLSGKRFAKSQSCVTMDTASFHKLTLIELLLTQSDNMCFAFHSFLHLDQSFFRFNVSGSKFFRVVLFNRTFRASLRRFNFNITFLVFPLDGKWLQSSTNPGSTGALIYSRMMGTLVSNSLSLTLEGMSEISRHSILE